MFKQIKDFFFGNKPAPVEQPKDVVLTPVDVAIRNIKETTESVTAKIEVSPKETPVADATPAPAPVMDQAWIKNPPAPIAKKATPRTQSVKATPAPRKKKPAPKAK
jgi:hypothetical protein